jgi:circadian clock protein KaiC
LAAIDRASSGIEALDTILSGGYVRHRIHLLEGRPGSGKTTLALQFLFEGRRLGEKTLYITLSETADELRSSAATHGWSLDGIDIFETQPADIEESGDNRQTLFHSSEIELGEVAQLISDKIDSANPARIVLDSLSEMNMLAQSPLRYRRHILALKRYLTKKGATVLLLDDLTAVDHDLQLHSIAHGVITLEQLPVSYGAERRRLRIAKMRGVSFQSGYHDYEIRTGGLDVFPRLALSKETPPPTKRSNAVFRSVAKELDDMLGGGLRRGTSTLLIGPAGSGKSSIALSYVVNAARHGEQTALYAFDEGLDSIFERGAGLGMDIRDHVKSGIVQLTQINPAEMSPGEFTRIAIRDVLNGAKVIVIDSLNGYLNAMPDEKNLVLQMHELLNFLNQRDVLTIVVVAQHGQVGNMQSTIDLSYLSDNVLLLRFFEAEGRIRKAISVLKKRVGSHQETIREFRLSNDGLKVGEPLVNFQGIMTGVPVYRGHEGTLKPPRA